MTLALSFNMKMSPNLITHLNNGFSNLCKWFLDNKIVGQFPWLTLPWGQIPDWHFPDRYFPDGHFPDWAIPQLDTSPMETSLTGISPLRHFHDQTFPQPWCIFKFLHFLAKLFVKANGLDFPLIFSWFIVLSINFIYKQLIYKKVNLVNTTCQCSAIIFSYECNNVQ